MKNQVNGGFSLVEALISLLVLSVGIIGAASMQLTALRNNQQAGFHGTGLQLASEVADLVRITSASNVSDTSNPLLSLDIQGEDDMEPTTASCFGDIRGCDDTSFMASMIHQLQSRLALHLPQGRIKVCRDDMPWNEGVNRYTWECEASGGIGPVVVKLGWREPGEALSPGDGAVFAPKLVLLVQA